jgi:hypothetical protein
MSVLNYSFDMGHGVRENCTLCGTKLARFPILHWNGTAKGTNISICGTCCQKIKVGFMEDLIQIAATIEMQQVRGSDTAFERTSQRELQDQAEATKQREHKIMQIVGIPTED